MQRYLFSSDDGETKIRNNDFLKKTFTFVSKFTMGVPYNYGLRSYPLNLIRVMPTQGIRKISHCNKKFNRLISPGLLCYCKWKHQGVILFTCLPA